MYDEGVAGVVASQGVAMFAPTLLHETPGRLSYVVPVAGPTWHGVDITVGPGVKGAFVFHQVADLGARGRGDTDGVADEALELVGQTGLREDYTSGRVHCVDSGPAANGLSATP